MTTNVTMTANLDNAAALIVPAKLEKVNPDATKSSETASNDASIMDTKEVTESNTITKPISDSSSQSLLDYIQEFKDNGDSDTSATDILKENGYSHLEDPGKEKKADIETNKFFKNEKIYYNEDGSRTVVTKDNPLLGGKKTTIEEKDKDGNTTKQTTVTGGFPNPTTTTTVAYGEDGKPASETTTVVDPFTGKEKTVVKQYLEDGSYVEVTVNKESRSANETATTPSVFDKDGNPVGDDGLTQEQIDAAKKMGDLFENIPTPEEEQKQLNPYTIPDKIITSAAPDKVKPYLLLNEMQKDETLKEMKPIEVNYL